jgi:ribosome-binding factor A
MFSFHSRSYYRIPVPAEVASRQQRRSQHRYEEAIHNAVFGDASLQERLVIQCGFTIHRVKLSADRRTAYVLWDAHPDKHDVCSRTIQHNAFKIRRYVANMLGSKFTPYLHFTHDHLPDEKAEVVKTMEQLQQQQSAGTGSTATTDAIQDDIEVAVSRLQAELKPRKKSRPPPVFKP